MNEILQPSGDDLREGSKPIVVIAGTHQEYQTFIHAHKLSPRRFRYVYKPEQIRGLRGASYILVGRIWLNTLYNKHPEELVIADMKEIKLPTPTTSNLGT